MTEPTLAADTCPHCGAAATDIPGEWACGSSRIGTRVRMSPHCETRQELATVTAERDALARRIAEAPVAWVKFPSDEDDWGLDIHASRASAVDDK